MAAYALPDMISCGRVDRLTVSPTSAVRHAASTEAHQTSPFTKLIIPGPTMLGCGLTTLTQGFGPSTEAMQITAASLPCQPDPTPQGLGHPLSKPEVQL